MITRSQENNKEGGRVAKVMWMRWENKIHILTLHVILTTVEVYAWYAIKIYKNKPKTIFKRRGQSWVRIWLFRHVISKRCTFDLFISKQCTIDLMLARSCLLSFSVTLNPCRFSRDLHHFGIQIILIMTGIVKGNNSMYFMYYSIV